ncbi:MAG: ribonuclease III [Candidatus Eremiobacteraeota bacterium]|nr:ribonuclease III [Candidatus Eremiobacteraeota bacterium]
MARHTLQDLLQYQFRDQSLLAQALRHESYAQESEESSQERLEFLGDSILGAVVSDFLFRHYHQLPEGRLAQMKAALVSTEQLAEKARQLELGDYVELGRGQQQEGNRQRSNLLADTLEALIGAIYLESGFETVRNLVLRLFENELRAAEEWRKDYKSSLQEEAQRLFQELPEYQVLEEIGPPHDRTFLVQVCLRGRVYGHGSGRSKREAGQKAAEEALSRLEGAGREQGEEATRNGG